MPERNICSVNGPSGPELLPRYLPQFTNTTRDLTPEQLNDPLFAKANLPFAGELYMGHLRYSTTGKSGISYIHPFYDAITGVQKNLAVCGNFNLTNVHEVFEEITAIGQHPGNIPIRILCWSSWDTGWTGKWSACTKSVRRKD